MNDLISRQALCDDLREYKVHPVPISSDESEVKGYNDGIDLVISVIAEFPSAEPEQTLESAIDYSQSTGWLQEHDRILTESAESERTAKVRDWSEDVFGHYRCDKCGFVLESDYVYCPNCGADMRGE